MAATQNATQTEETDADETNKRENFENVFGKRMSAVRDKILLLKKGANPNAYEFTQRDVDKMTADIKAWADEVKQVYTAVLKGEKPATTGEVYKFD